MTGEENLGLVKAALFLAKGYYKIHGTEHKCIMISRVSSGQSRVGANSKHAKAPLQDLVVQV